MKPVPINSRLDAKYCTGCGSPIEALVRQSYCPYCGCRDEGKKFCAECGTSLVDLPQKMSAQQPAATMAVQAAMITPAVTAQPTMMGPQPTLTIPETTQQPQWGGAQQPTTARLAKAYCPDCGNEATWVTQYNQWYCYVDQKYVATPSYTEPKKGLFRKH